MSPAGFRDVTAGDNGSFSAGRDGTPAPASAARTATALLDRLQIEGGA